MKCPHCGVDNPDVSADQNLQDPIGKFCRACRQNMKLRAIEKLPVLPEARAKDPPVELVPSEQLKVTQRITEMGYYYQAGERELGPFTVQSEQESTFDVRLAGDLRVEVKDILKARLAAVYRPTNFTEVADVLSSTVRRDLANKLILFCAGLLNFTDSDQVNILMSGESAGGKSYTVLEIVSYFPSAVIQTIGSASPTAFYHDHGQWDPERRLLVVDLRSKIICFLDMPHYMLLEKLRAMLSHDTRELVCKITDRGKKGNLRTKNVCLVGFPTIIFCAAKLSLDDQERTRVFILSPETTTGKLEESLRLAVARVGDREGFRQWLESHPRRRWLKARVAAIQNAAIHDVLLPDQEEIYKRFLGDHSRLAPRHQRDLPRILALIKGSAILNCWHREKHDEHTIIANKDDVEAGFWLYGLVAKPNELGLSPQVYQLYEGVIQPLLNQHGLIDRKQILTEYHRQYGRFLADEKLRREVIPALEASGLITQTPDPEDKRRMLMCGSTTDPPPISPPETIGETSRGPSPPTAFLKDNDDTAVLRDKNEPKEPPT